MSSNFPLPSDLPKPEDDGACNHLQGLKLPSLPLLATSGSTVDPSTLSGLTIVFTYPRTGAPGEQIPDSWDAIPGARGCSPQACSFRDLSNELLALGVTHVFGLSTQDTEYQREARERLRLPYQLLSDEKLEWARAVGMPVFEWEGRVLVKRSVMVVADGVVVKVFYPVFPPDASAGLVKEWLENEWKGRGDLSTEHEGELFRNLQKR